ncbi:DMT family transporter [Bacillus sp. 31A1R]|uniref:DMT family transporter n=1 Tax=Robertmurraya mangrovi TaxID=3098077 RepID=A0ABU5J2J8_9BACI|nr:DMT family transporter [Bacillus sp. 31A1R]MDZ5473643.1 DMT family transporter [Bacillus sp. 31A1R]
MGKGLLYSLLVFLMMVWGFNVTAIKILVMNFPPVFIQGIRVLLAGVVVLILLFKLKKMERVSRKNIIGIFVTALFGVLGHHLCLAVGLTTTTASNAGLILGLIPLSTSIFAMIFLKEALTILKSVGILIALSGVYFVILNGNGPVSGFSIGDLYIFGAVITQAISFILIKKLTNNLDSRQMTGIMLIFGSLMMIGVSFWIDPVESYKLNQPFYVWIILLVSAIFATGLGHMLYNYAIQQLGAGSTAIFINLSTFFSLLGSALFLGEMIVVEQLIGFILIVIGVIFGTGMFDEFIRNRTRRNTTQSMDV